MQYYECSAKDRNDVREAFGHVVAECTNLKAQGRGGKKFQADVRKKNIEINSESKKKCLDQLPEINDSEDEIQPPRPSIVERRISEKAEQ